MELVKLQLNLSTTATLGTEESGRCNRCKEVETRVNVRTVCQKMAVVERWPLWRGGHCGEVTVEERWPLWRGGHGREVAIVQRCPL